MKLPVPKWLATANANIDVAVGTNEDGAPNIVDSFVVSCRIEQTNAITYASDGTKVALKAKLFVFEQLDKFPDEMMGFCTVNGIKCDIANVSKKRNPDNSVNHIVLELI